MSLFTHHPNLTRRPRVGLAEILRSQQDAAPRSCGADIPGNPWGAYGSTGHAPTRYSPPSWVTTRLLGSVGKSWVSARTASSLSVTRAIPSSATRPRRAGRSVGHSMVGGTGVGL